MDWQWGYGAQLWGRFSRHGRTDGKHQACRCGCRGENESKDHSYRNWKDSNNWVLLTSKFGHNWNEKRLYEELAMQVSLEKTKGLEVAVIGDTNAHIRGHRSDETNDNGKSLIKVAHKIGLEILELDNITFTGRRGKPSCIDYLLITHGIRNRIKNEQILEDNTISSDHLPIYAQINTDNIFKRKMDKEVFRLDLLDDEDKRKEYQDEVERIAETINFSDNPDALYKEIIRIFISAVRSTLGTRKRQKPALPRSIVDKLRLAKQIYTAALELRAGQIDKYIELEKKHDQVHQDVRKDIKRWKKMKEIERRILMQQSMTQKIAWKTYRLCKRGWSGMQANYYDDEVKSTIDWWKSIYRDDDWNGWWKCEEQQEWQITLEDVREQVQSIRNGKAKGPDGVAGELIKYGGPTSCRLIHALMDLIWRTGEIPVALKEAYVILLPKKGNSKQPQDQRPITLVNSMFKILDKMIAKKL
ncbi:unnamed protein product [Blepharisma stoltei]|uniref:Endonuclease/exonuclease/phosphatase domain-containing protein n=1 Tax=Blepharisma stoltei TaxID=1481888 RepID=A0AAU9IBX5_9CILI|nr:unnamed protein product [Blepharisma stoltei]